MARKTDGEKIDELIILINRLETRLDAVADELHRLLDLPIRAAVLEHRVNDMRQGWERWLHRIWMLLAPLVGAGIGGLLTYYLNTKK